MPLVEPKRSPRACGARPSAGGAKRGKRPIGERPEMMPRVVFSEGRGLRARVVRLDASRGMSPSPAHWREHGGKKTPDSGWRHALLCGRAEPAPPRGGQAGEKAYRGKARDYAKGDFLGGARSPRPRGKVGCEPGHNMIIGGKRVPGGQMGTCSGEANSVVAGVRSPPLQGDNARQDGLMGESPEMAPKAIFSEGRTLCVRIARPCPCRGISLVEMVRRTAPGLTGTCLVQAQACFNGRAEPAPPRGGQAGEKAYRGKARDDAKGDFLGGARSPRP
jgi:hypothetical protein